MQQERVVFFAAPVGMHGSPDYKSAVGDIQDRHPGARVVPDEGLWTGAKHWRETYRQVLADLGVTDLYILTEEDGTVGRGIYEEWTFLKERGVVSATVLFPDGEELGDFTLEIIDRKNWTRYATPVRSRGGAV